MGIINPLIAFIIALVAFAILLYRRVGLGISLTAAALILGLLTIGPTGTVGALFDTLLDYNALTVILASFAIMLLSKLYKETRLINTLTESIGGLVRNSKVILGVVPAVIGLMPVAGGALMSAPMVEEEAKKLRLSQVKKTYVNLWFRHTIFPIYPVSQLLILTAALTQTSIFSIIYRQLPVVIGMIIIGYLIGLWRAKTPKEDEGSRVTVRESYVKSFLFSFSPIFVIIFLVAVVGINVAISAFIGVFFLIFISKLKFDILARILRDLSVYEVTLAAFGAFFLRNATETSGLSDVISETLIQTNFNEVILLVFLPFVLAFLMGSPSGGISISVPVLSEIVGFTSKSASLLYMSAYLGYLGTPTHLCLAFTVEYFKCSLSEVYKYLIPSIVISIIFAVFVYLLI